MRIVLCLLLTIFTAFPAYAEDVNEALFGLKWEMTPASVKALGVSLDNGTPDYSFVVYQARSLPKNLSDAEYYLLTFLDGLLVSVGSVGKNIADDPIGRDGKERFEILRKSLSDKYGSPTLNRQTTGNGPIYGRPDEFYKCLMSAGCGSWVAVFETPRKRITLKLVGLDKASGYVKITAEAKPEFDNERRKQRGSNVGKDDRGAL